MKHPHEVAAIRRNRERLRAVNEVRRVAEAKLVLARRFTPSPNATGPDVRSPLAPLVGRPK